MRLVKNMSLAATTALNHFADDPVVLALQISRRLPASMVAPAAKLITRAFPHSTSAPALLAIHMTGDMEGLESKLAGALTRGLSANRARLASDVALAAGLPEWADKFLALSTGARRLPSTHARRKWYDGDMRGAVEALEGQRGAMQRQRKRLAGERRIFSGWGPVLPQTPMIPVSGRVLHLLTNSLPYTGSGYAQRSHSILLAQQEAGLEVLAVTRLGYPVQVGKVLAAGEDKVDGITYRRMIPATLARTPDARLQQEAEELLKVALEFRPDILHTTTHFANGLVVGAVARALGIPWVYEVRGQLADTWASTRGKQAKLSERYRSFIDRETQVMGESHLVVTLGDSMRKGILGTGISAEKIILVPNGIGESYLSEPTLPEVAQRAVGLEVGRQYIGTVSSIVGYEGLDDLVGAFALLAPEYPNLRLLVVGNGIVLPELRRLAVDLGVADKVIFTGQVPRGQAHFYHQALDVFVVPRRDLDVTRAVTPLKPVEALASARPVVASDLPALREIIINDVNGLIFTAGDIQAMADSLQKLIDNPGLRLRMGQDGRERILQERSWKSVTRNQLVHYQILIRSVK